MARAALLTLPSCCSRRRWASRTRSCSSRERWGRKGSSAVSTCSVPIQPSGAMSAARSSTFLSSRTLPGQGWQERRDRAPEVIHFSPTSGARASRKWFARRARSPKRSRSGGTWMVSTARRWKRSSRNCPWEIRSWRETQEAATTRVLIFLAWVEPTALTSPFSRARSSLAWALIGSSPISSRKRVPPWAAAKAPALVETAPVKEPFSWPKSSVSMSSEGSAPMLSGRKGPRAWRLPRWRASAMSSLPLPVSPRTSTEARSGAKRRTSRARRSIAADRPTTPSSGASPERSSGSAAPGEIWTRERPSTKQPSRSKEACGTRAPAT